MRNTKSLLAFIVVLGVTVPALAQDGRTQLFASGLFNQSTFSFTDYRTFTLNLEQGAFSGRWSSAAGPAFSFGVTREIWKGLAFGVAVDLVGNTPKESFEAHVPHPFFFNRLRVVLGEADALSYDEKAIHVLVGYSRTVNRWVFVVTGGPSYIHSSTELVDAFQLNEAYPFDEVTLASSQSKRYDVGKLGFNAGGWVGYQILNHVAAGFDLRFSRATASFTTSGGSEIEITAGGVRVGGGVRVIF